MPNHQRHRTQDIATITIVAHARAVDDACGIASSEPTGVEQPSELENHIQFHGGFLEDSNFHTDPQRDGVMGHFYRMGIRHYSPSLGRFLQRDPLSYLRAPHKSNPLSLNPYIYAINRPTDLSDTSGYQPCPGGCGSAMGGISPDHIPPEFNTDPSGGNGTGGGDNHCGETCQDTKVTCEVPYPKECITDERYPYCSVECCRTSYSPPWFMGCCCGSCVSILINPCETTSEGDCKCACCLAGGEENAPATTGGGGITTSWMSPTPYSPIYGPPSIGPWGDGGAPWGFGPARPGWGNYPFDAIPINSYLSNGLIEPNLSSQISITALALPLPIIIIGGLLIGSGLIAVDISRRCANVKPTLWKNFEEHFDREEYERALENCCKYYACCAYHDCLANYWAQMGVGVGALASWVGGGLFGGAAIAVSGTAVTVAYVGPCLGQLARDWLRC